MLSHTIQDDEIYRLSQNICARTKIKFKSLTIKINETIESLRNAVKAKRQFLYAKISDYESYLMPDLIETTLKETGAWKAISKENEEIYNSRITDDLNDMTNITLSTIENAFTAHSHLSKLLLLDKSKDLLISNLTQLRIFHKKEKSKRHKMIFSSYIDSFEILYKKVLDTLNFLKETHE